MFQASNLKEKQFLDLVDDDNNIIEPTYVKEGLWLKVFGHLNSLCAYTTRAITNHAPISEFRLRFFPREEFKCLCDWYPIETRCHIFYECGRFNGYWNQRMDSLSHFIMFLVFNPSAFSFLNSLVSFSFLFLFSFSFPYSFILLYVVTKVATTVCLHALCNKFLI